MTESNWTAADTRRAEEIWAEYQKTYDVSAWKGQAAAIDPVTGGGWFGKRGRDAVAVARAAGNDNPVFCVRVGSRTYTRIGKYPM